MVRFKLSHVPCGSALIMACVVCSASLVLSLGCSSTCRCFNGTRVICRPQLNHFPSLPPNSTSIALTGSPTNENSIAVLKRSVLASYPNLEYLTITYSQMTSLENDVFHAVTNLTRIDLKNNRISRVKPEMFLGLTRLFELDLTNNIGCVLSEHAFRYLINLRFLYLGDLDLRDVNADMFSGLKNLKGLDLHGNGIIVLEDGVFNGMPILKTLDLSYNKIASLPDSLMPIFKKLRSILLGDNLWRCTCDLKWLKMLNGSNRHSVHGGSVPICMAPNRLKYHAIYNLSDKDLTCIPPKISQCGGPYDVKEGDVITLTCRVEGDLFPDVTWTRPDGNAISVPRIPFSSPQYETVRNVSVPPHTASIVDDGYWTIGAVNDKSKDMYTFRVNVEMLMHTSTSTTTITTRTLPPTTTATTTTTGAPTSPIAAPKTTSTGFLIAAAGLGGTICIGLTVYSIVVCCVKKNRVVPDKNNKHAWKHGQPVDELTLVIAPVSE